jgi:Uma2 family endonuclease
MASNTAQSEASSTRNAASFLEPPGDDILYEIVDNEVRVLPPMGARESFLASALFRVLSNFAWDQSLGLVVAKMLFLLNRATNLQRRPDLALVSFERWPRGRAVPKSPAWEVVPNLAIEVVSPSNLANDVVEKIEDYFLAGVQRVWVIYPEVEKLYDYNSPTSVRILTPDESLDGGDILPGLRVPLTEFLVDATPEPA